MVSTRSKNYPVHHDKKTRMQLHAAIRASRKALASSQRHNKELQRQKKKLREQLRVMESLVKRLHSEKVVEIAKKFARALPVNVKALTKRATRVVVSVSKSMLKSEHPEAFNPKDDPEWEIVSMPPPQKGPRLLVKNVQGDIRLTKEE